MADTIRDVVIRIAIEQKSAALAVPDTAAFDSAVEAAAKRMQDAFTKAAVLPAISVPPLSAPIAKPGNGGGSGRTRSVPGIPSAEDLDFAESQIHELDALIDQMAQHATQSGKQADQDAHDQMKSMRDVMAEELKLARERLAIREQAAERLRKISIGEKASSYQRDSAQSASDAIEKALKKGFGKSGGGIEEAESQLNRLNETLRKSEAYADKWGTAESRSAERAIRAMRDAAAASIDTQRQRIAANESASEKFKQIQLSERLSVINRVKDEEAILTSAHERFKKIATSERLAAYRRGQDAERAKEAEDAAKRIEAAKRKEAAAERFRQGQINTTVESIRSAGEGAFRSIRGLALITADTDEGLQQLLDRVRYVQGAWDVFSGTLQVGKGAMRAFTVAQAAATEAGGYYALVLNLVSGAQAKVGATGTAATVGVRGLAAVMGGPAVTTILAFVAVYSAATFVMGGFAKKAEDTADELDHLAERVANTKNVLADLQQAGLDFQLADNLASVQDQISLEEKLLGVMDRESDIRLKLQQIEKSGVNEKIKNGQIEEKTGIDILRAQEDLYKRAIDLSKEKIQIIRQEQDELRKNVQKYEEMAAAAKVAAEQERSRVESLQEAVGRLNEVERLELKALIEKKQAGQELTKTEAERFGQLGGSIGQQYLKNVNINAGKELAEQLSQAFTGKGLTGGGSALGEKQRSQRDAESLLDSERKKADKEIEYLGKVATNEIIRLQETYKKLFEDVLKVIQMLQERQAGLERQVINAGIMHRP